MLHSLLTKISNVFASPALTISAYDRIAEKYAKTFSETSRFIDNFLKYIPAGENILDAGCGIGTDSTYMLSKGYKVVSVDLSEEMLKIAHKNNPGHQAIAADIRQLRFPSDSFVGIFASYSLIHLKKDEGIKVIKNFYHFLKPQGIFYLSLQSGISSELFVSSPLKQEEKLFLKIFSPEEIKNILTNCGFTIIEEHIRKPLLPEEHNFEKLYIIAKK